MNSSPTFATIGPSGSSDRIDITLNGRRPAIVNGRTVAYIVACRMAGVRCDHVDPRPAD